MSKKPVIAKRKLKPGKLKLKRPIDRLRTYSRRDMKATP